MIIGLCLSLIAGWLTGGLANALLGGLTGFGLFMILALLGRGKLGAGDVKLAELIGQMSGYPTVRAALA